ncbi:MAG TPA: ribonuclease HII [Methanocorpusculum sp.]|nr:ribonuclease HII [Methanocorpusculum sp.]
MLLCGIDEAGKGPVIGPMVTAGVLINDEEESFVNLSIKDSKKLTPKKREELFTEITSRFRYYTCIRTPQEIDTRKGTMNEFTVSCHAEVLRTLQPDLVYLDACDVNAERFGINVVSESNVLCQVISEHKADAKFTIVGAASIVAKVTRDHLIDEIKTEFGNVGSGYPSDPVTIAFLTSYIEENGKAPSCARTSWQTVKDLLSKTAQKSLTDF